MIFISCESEPKFKVGMYVTHIQSECVGIVELAYKSKPEVLLGDYICKIESDSGDTVIKGDLMYFHVINLKYSDSRAVEWYHNALGKFAKKAEEQKK